MELSVAFPFLARRVGAGEPLYKQPPSVPLYKMASSAEKPHHHLPTPFGATAAPPPTPSTQSNRSSESTTPDFLSHLLHRFPPTLSLSLPHAAPPHSPLPPLPPPPPPLLSSLYPIPPPLSTLASSPLPPNSASSTSPTTPSPPTSPSPPNPPPSLSSTSPTTRNNSSSLTTGHSAMK
ncbi:hypothetical protein Pfo_015232 [Paulownia fortunei]|nr:hypothetical protein Pfo_015232 [Paulownia fortunei]